MPSFPRAMHAALVFASLLLGACSSQKRAFLHSFRERYSITDEEIKNLQFYTSTDLLAKTSAAPTGDTGTATESVLVPAKTPGVVTGVGPAWIRVSFREGHSGVRFMANPPGARDAYYLATEVEGKDGFHILQDLDNKVLLHEGQSYIITYGTSATLHVALSALEDLKEKRMTVPGREK